MAKNSRSTSKIPQSITWDHPRHAVYCAAVGGAGALLSKCITKSEIVCYEDLGAEAIRKLQVKDFPVIVVIDSEGNNLYETAIKKYCTLE